MYRFPNLVDDVYAVWCILSWWFCFVPPNFDMSTLCVGIALAVFKQCVLNVSVTDSFTHFNDSNKFRKHWKQEVNFAMGVFHQPKSISLQIQQCAFPKSARSADAVVKVHGGSSSSDSKSHYQNGWLLNGEIKSSPTSTMPRGLSVHGDVSGSVMQVCLGAKHGILLTDEGLVYTWGENSYGQLG